MHGSLLARADGVCVMEPGMLWVPVSPPLLQRSWWELRAGTMAMPWPLLPHTLALPCRVLSLRESWGHDELSRTDFWTKASPARAGRGAAAADAHGPHALSRPRRACPKRAAGIRVPVGGGTLSCRAVEAIGGAGVAIT